MRFLPLLSLSFGILRLTRSTPLSVPVSSSTSLSYSCQTDADCEYLGTCTNNVCTCATGFYGESCGMLHLQPIDASCTDCLPVWPKASENNANGSSAWGFSVAYDPSDNLYHAFVTVACGGDGVIGNGGGDSWIAHLSSSTYLNGYEFQNMVVPQTSFGPHIARSPNGTFAFVFRVNLYTNTTLCGGNGTDPLPYRIEQSSYISYSDITPGNPENGTNIFIGYADRMTGPWNVVRLNVTNGGTVHKSNPSITFLSDGRILLGYRYNSKIGELNAFAFAVNNNLAEGIFECVYNLTNGMPGDEDPFVWEQPDGTLHAIYHNKNYGYHAYAVDQNGRGGYQWAVTPLTGTHAFNLTVPFTNGTNIELLRRERPEIYFDPATKVPLALYNGVLAADETAFVLTQAFVTN